MSRFLILAQSELSAKALGKWLELLGESPLVKNDERVIIDKSCSEFQEWQSIERFSELLYALERNLDKCSLGSLTVLVDSVKPELLNPLADGGWNQRIAMLILSFPEVRWYFGVINEFPRVAKSSDALATTLNPWWNILRNSWNDVCNSHSLPHLLAFPPRLCLFDPTALRNFVRNVANGTLLTNLAVKSIRQGSSLIDISEQLKSLLPRREKKAASIDEEANYAIFHAYTAYRFGYCTEAVLSWELMELLFGNRGNDPSSLSSILEHGFDLLLEDVNLNFPDKPGNVHLSKFDVGRAMHCPALDRNEASRFRIIVTSGHSGADAKKMDANLSFVEGYKRNGSGLVFKPVGGIFDLWEKANLFHWLCPKRDPEFTGRHSGQAFGFFWPTLPSQVAEEAGGHSAPGKLMLIAQHLVRRSDALRETADTVDECICGAVLATEALELLRYQTPTLALQALCLKHEYEVKAEVTFLGVGHHFDLRQRFNELEREVRAASRYFRRANRRSAELDILVSIGNRLMLVFREAGQFDEELACLVKIRSWHRQLRRNQSRKLLDLMTNRIMEYAEWLLVSPKVFIGMLGVWFLGLWLLWYLCGLLKLWIPEVEPNQSVNFLWGSASAAWNSFAVSSPDWTDNPVELVLNIIGSAAGLFHLGVFISFLYSSVSRK